MGDASMARRCVGSNAPLSNLPLLEELAICCTHNHDGGVSMSRLQEGLQHLVAALALRAVALAGPQAVWTAQSVR